MLKCFRWRSNRHKFAIFVVCLTLFLINKKLAENSTLDYEDSKELVPAEVGEEQKEEKACERPSVTASKCSADNGKSMKCWKDDEDVYFPFNFIKKRFDMTGKMSKDGYNFEIFTSYSKIRVPDTSYNSSGAFGHFSTYSVETRDRVRCISAETDVPMSTQWDPKPYYYPIQITQYGLQHFSKMKQKNFQSIQITKGEKSAEWKGAAAMDDTTERMFYDDAELGNLVNISAEPNLANAGAYVYLDNSEINLNVVQFEWKPFDRNASFTVLAKLKEGDLLVLLNYVLEDKSNGKCVWLDEEKEETIGRAKKDGQVSFSYSLYSKIGNWSTISRDILVDVARALSSTENRKKDDNVILHPGDIRLVSIGFRGKLTIRQRIVQTNNQHVHAFRAASNWLVKHQNEHGGWEVPVERAIADRMLVLPPGWHSAMGQGHGISVLTRAFVEFKDFKYLEAAVNAVNLFKKNSSEGGVQAHFFGNIWFEEYPTTPGTFVLNGFMYSLIGLYDLSQLKAVEDSKALENIEEARNLYCLGVKSLKKLLPLYDTGSGTIYDLRHVGLKTAPNLARWDYHAVHVYLLKWIGGIENDKYLNDVAGRWIGYANGKRAKHN